MNTILITSAGSGTGFSYVAAAKKHFSSKINLITCDVNRIELVTSSLFSDQFIRVPYADDKSYSEVMEMILLTQSVDIVIPILNDEIMKLSRLCIDNDSLSKISTPQSSLSSKIACDKNYCNEWLHAIEVPVPEKYESIESLPEKLFAKPKNGFGSRGSSVVNRSTLQYLDPDYLYQEVLTGPEVTVDTFFDPANNFFHCTARERIEVKSGVCVKARVFDDPDLASIARNIASKIGITGGFCFQVMKSQNGWVVMDLNTRLGAGSAISSVIGRDYFSASIALMIGENYADYLSSEKIEDSIWVTRQYSEYLTYA